MRTVLAAIIGIVALSISSLNAAAEGKKCKPGYEYDDVTGRCVLMEGS